MNFKVGDVVKFPEGSMPMTVESVGDYKGMENVTAAWFDGDRLAKRDITRYMLWEMLWEKPSWLRKLIDKINTNK